MELLREDCLVRLKELPTNSIDGCVTDPPAGISFMNKEWDSDKGGRDGWIAWMTEVFSEVKRVLKPGAHALVWSIPRTSHWTGMSLEDAGFEVRDCVHHIYGQGFPKSHNIGKGIDKKLGNTREIIGDKPYLSGDISSKNEGLLQGDYSKEKRVQLKETRGKTEYEGYGTQLKPAVEVWWLIRKPLSEKTIVSNVLKHGTGALNIDKSRVNIEKGDEPKAGNRTCNIFETQTKSGGNGSPEYIPNVSGRFPSNVIHDGIDEEWSKYFYCSKASKAERQTGIKNDHPTIKSVRLMSYLINLIMPPTGVVLDPFMGSGTTGVAALLNGYDFLGIEMEREYLDIAQARINEYESFRPFLK